MSALVGTGNNLWSGLYIIISTVGFVVLVALLRIFYTNPYQVSTWWYQGLLFIACMVASVIIFGGLVIGLWHHWDKKVSSKDYEHENGKINFESVQSNETAAHKDLTRKNFESWTIIQYGSRPDFKGCSHEKTLGFHLLIVCPESYLTIQNPKPSISQVYLFVFMQKYLDPSVGNGGMLMLVPLFVALQLLSQVLLRKSGGTM